MAVPPRLPLALAPTPILKLERLSRRLGVELFVKRDDLTGLLESGNKVRKLEFLVGEALEQRADTLITCGTLQSNCCRAVAAVAARLGLNAALAVKGSRPAAYDGNLLLDRLLGAEVRYLSDAEWERVDDVMEEMAAELRERGHQPYVIPESGSNEGGALGYLGGAGGGVSEGAVRRAPRGGPPAVRDSRERLQRGRRARLPRVRGGAGGADRPRRCPLTPRGGPRGPQARARR